MSEAHKTFIGVDGQTRTYRQVFLPFDHGQDLLQDIMDAMIEAVSKMPKGLLGGDGEVSLKDVNPADIVEVVGTFSRHIRKFGKPSEFFARVFLSTSRQTVPGAPGMQSLGDKVVRDSVFAGSHLEAWQVAMWVVWHNYSPFLMDAMRQLGVSLTSSSTPSSNSTKAKTPEQPVPELSAAQMS